MKYLKYFENYITIGDKEITQEDLNLILKGYIDCALWTEEERLKESEKLNIDFNEDDEDDELDEIEKIIRMNQAFKSKSIQIFTKEDIDFNSLIAAYTDIKKFISEAGSESVDYAIEENGLERLGHDIWLTRNGHGAGFFDHSYDDDIEKKLTEAAEKLKEAHLYITDDNKLAFI